MDEQNVIYPYNGILFGNKKEQSVDKCYSIDETWGHCAKWKNSVTEDVNVLYDSIYMKWPG